MVKRPTASRRRKRGEASKAFRNIAIVIALIGFVAFFYVRAVISNRTLDEETLCPAELSSITVLLVDVTDPMNLAQRQDFMNQLDRVVQQIPRYGKLAVVKVDPISDRLLIPVITRCNPGSASDVSDVDGNKKQLEQQRKERFEEPLEAAFDGLLEASSADRSPILESVQSVALTELQKLELEDTPKRLIIASDLLQNTSTISFYGGLPESKAFTSSQKFSRVRTDLKGSSIELWMLQRDDSNQTQPLSLINLWQDIIQTQGGALTRVYRVSG